MKIKVAIIGSGNIGTDLTTKILRNGKSIEMGDMVGTDPKCDGLAQRIAPWISWRNWVSAVWRVAGKV